MIDHTLYLRCTSNLGLPDLYRLSAISAAFMNYFISSIDANEYMFYKKDSTMFHRMDDYKNN